ncbi:uncharacterized protein [Enoplosus armatus]|uniref:uncharacterized protein n=1 Tax=Enoplosus armatus TaxID=215367 RepID=UPI003991BC2A
MMIVLLLLSACVCLGLSYEEYEYGNTYRIRLHRKAQSFEFNPKYSSDVTILWKRDDPVTKEDSRRQVMGSHYVIFNVTQKDSGHYIMRDKDQNALAVKIIEVTETTKTYSRSAGDSFNFTFYWLEPNSCNIYFFPEDDHDMGETEIVRRGRLQPGVDYLDCAYFDLVKPCGISNKGIKTSCSGRFEVRDQNDNKALVVLLEVEPQHFDSSSIGIGVGIFFAVLSCCGCMRRCCCAKKKKDAPEAADAEPAVHYQEYESEPVGPRPDHLSQPSGTRYPAQPYYTPTGPLIHNPPPVNAPPAYSEVSALAEQADAPTVPIQSDLEPRFELKAMSFPSAPPLSSDSTYCDVYTSDKLNFL